MHNTSMRNTPRFLQTHYISTAVDDEYGLIKTVFHSYGLDLVNITSIYIQSLKIDCPTAHLQI